MENIAVFGLGYVGLPLSLIYALYGHKVWGYDINKNHIENIKNGNSSLREYHKGKDINKIIKEVIEKNLFILTDNPEEALKNTKNIIFTVGVPIQKKKITWDPFIKAVEDLGKNLKKGDSVIIRSTVPVGTTRNVVLPILEKESKMKAGLDFYLSYSSERIAEGAAFEEFETMPIVVSGIDDESCKKASYILSLINKEPLFKASSIEVVEAAKLFENSSRDVNIALVNELSRFAMFNNLDIYEIIEACNTHKRVKLLRPGIGVGGHCIPYSSLYIFESIKGSKIKMPMLESARKINDEQPEFIKNEILKLFNRKKDITLSVIGVAMKDNSDDISESPTMELIEILKKEDIEIKAYDPVVHNNINWLEKNLIEALDGVDGIIFTIKQKELDYHTILNECIKYAKKDCIIIDIRKIFGKEEVLKKGLRYFSI